MIINHAGDNKYYGPALKPGEKKNNFSTVHRDVAFNLDHLDEEGIAKLVSMGAVVPIDAPGKAVASKEK
jgi:hypothetical protein